jgi:His/Glu/Gln/Arg/opine family amino acid ABC transporter permease subunit
MTLLISGAAMVFATVAGLPLALARLSRRASVRVAAGAYIEFMRNTPLLHQLFLLFFGLPLLGIYIPGFIVGALGLAGLHAAYMAEVFRAGIQSIGRKQQEAGLALAMSSRQVMARIVLPQAIPASLPPLVNQMVLLIKDSSLVSTIGIAELTLRGRVLAESTAATYEVFAAMAMLYLLLTGTVAALGRWLEPRIRAAG